MDPVLEKINEFGIVPVVKLAKPEEAVPLGKALAAGHLPVAEITFRSSAAEEGIRNLTTELPELLVGAGTVITIDQADRAIKAGAKFIVAPGLNPRVVEFCQRKMVPVLPGVVSPTQIEAALEMGLEILKFFPAEAAGGIEMLKAFAGPFPDVKFVPTGGISPTNMVSYLDRPNVFAVGGSWMVKNELISASNFAEITRLTREAVLNMLGFEFRHLGINDLSEEEASSDAHAFADLFGFPMRHGSTSYYVDPSIEVLKQPVLGRNGHIAIQSNSVGRAVAFLKRRGYGVRLETARHVNERLTFVYLEKEVGGFAIHLLQKGEG